MKTDYRDYATDEPLRAMAQFTGWIEREFPEFGKLNYRVVTVAFKCYGAFKVPTLTARDLLFGPGELTDRRPGL